MKLRELKIEQFRGIRDLKLEFSDEGILIYGPNGVGKSSTLQGIEYLLTGEVEDLKGSGTGRHSQKRDLWHKDASPEVSQVTAKFSQNGESVRVRRCVSDGDLQILSDQDQIPHSFQALQTAVKSKQNILTRDELLRFIDVADHERSEVLNNILRLDEIDSFRKTVQTVSKEFKNNFQRAKEKTEELRAEFYNELQGGAKDVLDSSTKIASNETALEIVNNLRNQYGAEPLSSLEEKDFTAEISEPENEQVHPLARSTTKTRLSRVHNWVSTELLDVCLKYQELQDQIQEFESDPELRRDVRSQDLIAQGQRLIEDDGDKCPLCLDDWSDRELQSLLTERQQNAEEAADLREEIKSLKEDIAQDLREVLTPLNSLVEDLERADPTEFEDDIGEWANALNDFHSLLHGFEQNIRKGDLLEIPLETAEDSELKTHLLPTEYQSTVDELIELEKNTPESDDTMEAYGTLAVAQDRFESFLEQEESLDSHKQYMEISAQLESEYQSVRSQLLDDTLDEIKEEFVSLLSNLTNDIDVSSADVKLQSYDDGIKFRPPFHDGETRRPQLFYSDGQQDIIGLSLFLAMCRSVTKEEVGLVLLDDVLSSVDAEHRSQVAEIVDSAYGDEFQFILTTHDKVWSRHLRQTANIDHENIVHLSDWDYKSGTTQHIDITNPWKNIEFHLENNDITAAAAWARKTAEFFGAKGCKQFDTQVRFRDIEHLGFEDYFQSLMPKLTELAQGGETVSESAGDSEEGEDIVPTVYCDEDLDDLISTLGEMQSIKEQNLWGMHRNVHHSQPEKASYSETELRKNIEAFEDIFDVLYCSVCDCWREESNRGIECECSLLWLTP
jgi:DNA repair exonuclease SbcCD ATPase subunit